VITQRIRLALLGVWLGAMAFFSFAVAPAAFAVLPSSQLAGNLVSRTLGIVEIIGIVLGLILLTTTLLSRERRSKAFWFEVITTASMTISMIVSRFVVSKSLHDLRLKYGDQLSTMAQSEPVRVTFDQLHQYSVWLMGFNIITAVILIVILMFRTPSLRSHA
jgi:hypothetical protein